MNIDKYASKVTDPNYPIQAKIVRNYIKSVLYSNDIVQLEKATKTLMSPTIGQENRLSFIRSLHSDVPLFQDINSLSIIVYSLKKKDRTLFEMIKDAFFPSGALIETNGLNFSETVSDKTDCNSTTDDWFTTDWDFSLVVFMFLGLYCTDSEMKNKIEQLIGISIPTSEEFDEIFYKATRMISIVKPMRVDVGFLRVPTIMLVKSGGTYNCYGLEEFVIIEDNFPTSLNDSSFDSATIGSNSVYTYRNDDESFNATENKKCIRTYLTHSKDGLSEIEIKNGDDVVLKGKSNTFKKQTSSVTYCVRLYVCIEQ